MSEERLEDYISAEISPFLVYLGDKGITPKIFSATHAFEDKYYGKSDFIVIKKVGTKSDAPELKKVGDYRSLRLGGYVTTINFKNKGSVFSLYEKLGFNLGFMYNNFPLLHRDLHLYNIVIENNLPVIVDWGKAEKISDAEFNSRNIKTTEKNIDIKTLLQSTEHELTEKNKILLNQLKGCLLNGLRKGFLEKIPESIEEICKNVKKIYIEQNSKDLEERFFNSLFHK